MIRILTKLNINNIDILKSFLINIDIKNYNLRDGKTAHEITDISHLCYPTVVRNIKILVELGLLKEGLKQGRSKTYVLTNAFFNNSELCKCCNIPDEVNPTYISVSEIKSILESIH